MTIVVSEHLCASLPGQIAAILPHAPTLVADRNTHAALGAATIERILAATGGSLLLLDAPQAALSHAEALAAALHDSPSAIAIGSGTINDLVKYAAHRCGIPYAVIATATSMNGYSSSTASLRKERFKHSFAATAPIAIFADTGVLARAPRAMRAAGVGDTLCRTTIQTDWHMAHTLTGIDYDARYFTRLGEWEAELLAHPEYIAAADTGMMRVLFMALIAAGDAMREHGSSMPASQGEHMIAHTMEYLGQHTHALHGEEIAVTTLTMSHLQHRILTQPQLTLRPLSAPEALWQRFPPAFRSSFDAKAVHFSHERLLDGEWSAIREQVREFTIPPDQLATALQKAGCPTQPQQLGWSQVQYDDACRLAYMTRERFTFLDLAAMTGA